MPRSLSPEHPSLVKAAARLRRILYTWAALFGGTGLLGLAVLPGRLPVVWILGAALVVLIPQPALLAMVAVAWGLSLLGVSPDLNRATGLDPVGALFAAEGVESLAIGFVRLVLALMAWNQFLFYRLLYGTASMASGAERLPPIPEVVPNQTRGLTYYAWAGSLAGGLCLALGLRLPTLAVAAALQSAALGLAVLAIGLGVGVAFSPTQHRGAALAAVVIGGFVFTAVIASLPR